MSDTKRINAGEGEPDAGGESGFLRKKLLESRTILLSEQVSKSLAERVNGKLLFLDQEDPAKPVDLYINSPGGDVDAGFAIYDMVRFISAPVRCISAGLTASAAVIVLLAAPKERRMSLANSRFLMHQPSTGVQGTTADVKIEAREILRMREKINKIIAEETGQSVEKVAKDTKRNYWIGAEEALEYGLISRIVASRGELKGE
jgi:ATP-dependent Clp protease protease subunit